MKVYCLFLITMISFQANSQTNEYSEWIEKPELHDFSEIVVWRYDISTKSDSINSPRIQCNNFKDSIIHSVKRFNANHFLIYEKGYIGYHCSFKIKTYEYDNSNRLIIKRYFSRDSILEDEFVYDFDDDSRIRYSNYFLGGQKNQSTNSYYSINGTLDSSIFVDNKGFMSTDKRILISNNLKGKLLVWKIVENDSTILYYRVQKRNSYGSVIEDILLENDSTFSQGDFFEYNNENILISKQWVVLENNDKVIRSKEVFTYNKAGNLKILQSFNGKKLYKEQFYSNGILDYSIHYYDGIKYELFKYVYK